MASKIVMRAAMSHICLHPSTVTEVLADVIIIFAEVVLIDTSVDLKLFVPSEVILIAVRSGMMIVRLTDVLANSMFDVMSNIPFDLLNDVDANVLSAAIAARSCWSMTAPLF